MFTSIFNTMGSTLSKMVPKSFALLTPLIGAATGIAGKLVSNAFTQSVSGGSSGGSRTSNTVFTQSVSTAINQTNRVRFSDIEVNATTETLTPEFSGYVPDMTGGVPSEYIITIRNSRNWIVKSILQDISFSTDSTWNPVVPAGVGHLLNSLSQAISGTAPLSKWSSRRIWQGTSPITMNLELKFKAIYDEWKEVVRPCMRLQQMSLPRMPKFGSSNFSSDAIPFIIPPGPSPFFSNMEEVMNWDSGNQIISDRTGDKIYIQIGNFLKFESVIIKNVKASYTPQMSSKGYPVSGTVNLTFETFQMLSVEDLEKAHLIKG